MKRITILYIIDTFFEMAGAERNIFEIVTRLDHQRYNPILICLKGGKLVEILRSKGIEVTDLKLNKIYSLNAFLEAIKLYKLIKKNNVKIVVTYHQSSDFWGGLIAKLAGVPVIISSRRDMGYNLKKIHFLFYKLINNLFFDKIITVSDAVKNMLIKRQNVSEDKIVTIYNGVNLEKFSITTDTNKIKKSLGLNPGNPVVGILAVLRPIKGHRYFFEAASIILKSVPEAQFLVIGWSGERDYFLELKGLAKYFGVSQNVIFTGGRSDIENMLSIMDVSVNSSLSEGFSNTILETSAAGKPIVATNCGGNPEAVINGETGFLVPPKNAGALAEAISNLLRNKKLAKKIGLAGRRRIESSFSFQRMMSNVAGLYELLYEEKVIKRKTTLAKLRYSASKNVFTFLKNILSIILYYSGILYLFRELNNWFSKDNSLRILAYHKISNDIPNYLGLNTSVSGFENQIRYLKRHYNLISLDKAIQLIQNGKKLPKNAVVVTFDDGYQDFYANAFPIIKKYNIPVTVFLTIESIDSEKILWFEEIINMLVKTNKILIDLSDFSLGKYLIANSAQKEEAIVDIVNLAKGYNRRELQELIEYISNELEVNLNGSNLFRSQMLSWKEIIEMKNKGISFGTHAMSHQILTRIPLEEAEFEICESKRILEKRLKQRISSFAYPNGGEGDFNKEIIEIIKNSGFSYACTLIPGVNNTNEFTLKRKCINEGLTLGMINRFSNALFAMELTGIFDFLKGRYNE